MQKSKLHLLSKTALATITASLVMPIAAQAQLSDIIVTATKTEKSLQDLPMSIEAISGDFLNDYRIEDFKGLSDNVPNLTISTGLTSTNVIVRGLGSGQERGFEQSVGMFIDGQYMPRSRQYRAPFFDVERVEVVKGPQAVYFGLNSTAGAVAVHTKRTRPGDGADGYGSVDFGLDIGGQTYEAAMGVSGEKIGLRLAGKVADTDGYFFNSTLNKEEGGEKNILIRGTGIFDIAEGFRLSGKIEHSDFKTFGHAGEIFSNPTFREAGDSVLDYVRTSEGSTFAAGAASGIFPKNGEAGSFSTANNAQIGAEIDVAGGLLTATVGFSEFDYAFNVDLDNGALAEFDAAIIETYSQDSFDVRWQSDQSKQYRVMIGGYHHNASWFNLQPVVIGLQAFGIGANTLVASIVGQPTADFLYPQGMLLHQGSDNDIDSKLTSAYATVDFDISDQLSATVGARWSEETKDLSRNNLCFFTDPTGTIRTEPASVPTLDAFNLCPNVNLAGLTRSRKSTNFMPEASISYEMNDNVNLFARVGNSAKAGGFATSGGFPIDVLEYDDESVIGYELGVKSRLMDGKAELNATLYRSDFKDLQVNSFIVGPPPGNLPVATVSNAAKAVSQGIEVDGRLFINDSVTMGASVAYLDANYTDFSSAPCDRAGPGGSAPAGAISGCDFSDRELPFAPDYSGNLYFNLDHNMGGDFSVIGGAKLAFSGAYFTDGTLEADGRQDSWTKIDASIGIAHSNGMEFSIIATNLTDEAVLGSNQAFSGYLLGYLEKPRQVVARVKWQFQ